MAVETMGSGPEQPPPGEPQPVPQAPETNGREGVYRTPMLSNRIPEPEPKTAGPSPGGQPSSALAAAHRDGRLACRLAVDIGGTFTDAVLEDGEEDPRRLAVKVLTTPRQPAEGFMAAATRALQAGGRRPENVRLVLHGTTLATNAILERRGARTAVVTTRGFRDVLDVGRGGRHDCYDLGLARTPPIVPQRLRFEVRQRHLADGREAEPLDEDGVAALAERLRAADIESVAICFLHSHVNGVHEERAATILRTLLPGVRVCTSASVSPEVREYERFSTAVINAYVQPLMSRYLAEVQRALAAAAFRCPLLLMTSGGGLVDADTAAALPVRLVESGPAGGVALAENVARELGASEVLALDMGGTTAKICAVAQGRAALAREFEVDRAERFRRQSGLPVRIPCLDLVEISGGGGSIAATSATGTVTVGPRSAGAEPGPACYARGGTAATVTDADVLLGRADPCAFAAGQMQLRPELAREALRHAVMQPQGFASEELSACAVAETVEEAMAAAARAHAAEHGRDLDRHALIAFGGAAPLHAAPLAERLGLAKVLVPPDASVGSAIGFLSAPLAFEVVKSKPMCLDVEFDAKAVNGIFRSLWHEAISVVAAGAARWKPGRPAVERRRACGRYLGQGREVSLELPNRDLEPEDVKLLHDSFDDAYRRLFSRTVPGAKVEILTWALDVVADSDPLSWPRERLRECKRAQCQQGADLNMQSVAPPTKRPRTTQTRRLWDAIKGEAAEVPLYRREELPVGVRIPGPAVVGEPYTSTVVTASFDFVALENGFLQLERRALPDVHVPRPRPGVLGGFLPSAVDGAPDTFMLQLMWARLLASAEEQAQALLRMAFSPVTREANAISSGVFDLSGRLLAQSATGTPGLAGALSGAVGRFLEACPARELVVGDVLLSNDPWTGTGHLCDFTAVTPVFSGISAVGFVASVAQTTEAGGSTNVGMGSDMMTQGKRSPVVRLMSQGSASQVVTDALRNSSRRPDECIGDIFALTAANDIGVQRVREMLAEFGCRDLKAVADHICNTSYEAVVRSSKKMLPTSGTWQAQVDVDLGKPNDLEHPACLRLSASLSGPCGNANTNDAPVCLELESAPCGVVGGDQQRLLAALGVPFAFTEAYAHFALSCIFARGVPQNAGVLRAFRVTTSSGSVLASRPPSDTQGRAILAQLLPDLIFDCLSQVVPDEVPAYSASAPCRLELQAAQQGDSSSGHTRTTAIHVEGGGVGAHPCRDGLSAAIFPSGLRCMPIEVTEAAGPFLVCRRELRCDTGGAGRHRGGLGLLLEVRHADAGELRVSAGLTAARRRIPACPGGGLPGAVASLRLSSGEELPPFGPGLVPSGVSLLVETAGGGGFGPPGERSHEAVLEDVRNGFVSREAAVRQYCIPQEAVDSL